MILEIRPLAAGNALHLFLRPPAGAVLWRVLRKPQNTIASETDPDALVAYEGTDKVIIDAEPGLVNEQPAWYRAFFFVGGVWVATDAKSGTPVATYEDASTDVQSLVRERVEKGLAVEVARETLKPGETGVIAVYTAPPVAEEVEWPVVTVQLESDRSGERGIGEILEADHFQPVDAEWVSSEGYLADVSVVVSGWCLNPDERVEFRKALRRLIVANFAVFDAAGMTEIQLTFGDADFINGEFAANVFQTNVTLSCKAPVIVREYAQKVVDVQSAVVPIFGGAAVEAPVFN